MCACVRACVHAIKESVVHVHVLSLVPLYLGINPLVALVINSYSQFVSYSPTELYIYNYSEASNLIYWPTELPHLQIKNNTILFTWPSRPSQVFL